MKQMKEEFIEEEGSDFPGKTYMNCVLKHVFEFQREHLLYDMFMVHRAHIIMLIEEKNNKFTRGKRDFNSSRESRTNSERRVAL